MPDRSDKYEEAHEAVGEYELPYISKSRLKQWVENPEHFRLKYLEGFEVPETGPMVRGTRIHESFEDFYYTAMDYVSRYGRRPGISEMARFLPHHRKWADFTEPYISNFLLFEQRRAQASAHADEWLPVGIEDEIWVERNDDQPEWNGIADVLYNAGSVPEVSGDDGVVVVDFKTGSVPDEKYRDDGIYLELAYYKMLFGERYDVTAAGAYYPREDTFITLPEEKEAGLVEDAEDAVAEMLARVEEYDGDGQFETKPGPLCGWSPDEGCRSDFYDACPCTWNVVPDNQDTYEFLKQQGLSKNEIAERMGTTANAVGYWDYKLNQ